MSYQKMFSTANGAGDALYLQNPRTGLWLRHHKTDGPIYYLGSVDPQVNQAFNGEGYIPRDLEEQILAGEIEGFLPIFQVGRAPIGLDIDPRRVLALGVDVVKIKGYDIENPPALHVGHNIQEILSSRCASLVNLHLHTSFIQGLRRLTMLLPTEKNRRMDAGSTDRVNT